MYLISFIPISIVCAAFPSNVRTKQLLLPLVGMAVVLGILFYIHLEFFASDAKCLSFYHPGSILVLSTFA